MHQRNSTEKNSIDRLLTGTGNRSGEAAAFDVDARPVVVLVTVRVSITRQLENTDVPVGTVAAGAGLDRGDLLSQGSASGRVPESNSVGGEVNLVSNVVPNVGKPLSRPLRLSTNAPPEKVVGDTGSTREPTRLELGEVALEESDLVLTGGCRRVDILAHQGEVIVNLAADDGSVGLRDELCPSHVLAVPVSRLVKGDLGTLLGPSICWVLVVGGQVDVVGHGRGAVDIVLIGPDLVSPRPFVEVG